jgi:hypothetical protein
MSVADLPGDTPADTQRDVAGDASAASPPEAAAAPARAPALIAALQGWDGDDRKLLMITIIGTVAANLITVLVVALAFVAYRIFVVTNNWQIIPPGDLPRSLRWLLSSPSLWFEIPAGLVLYGSIMWRQLRKKKEGRNPLFLGFASGGLLLYLLIVIGLVSGKS